MKKTELLFLRFNSLGGGDESKLRCSVSLAPSVRPGASSGLQPPLRSLGGNREEKRGKSDTLAGLGVCQSVKWARGETPQQSAHTPSP